MIQSIRKFENLHILLWLMKDTCWVFDFKTLGVISIIPTLGVSLYITWLGRSVFSELMHNLAVSSWICANSVWMIGEFFFEDTLRPFAILFFILGLALITCFYVMRLNSKNAA